MARQQGPIYDGAVKDLCKLCPEAVCTWLGLPVTSTTEVVRLSETLPPVTRQVDALLAVDAKLAVHIEFQTAGEARFARRMLDYRLRLTDLPELAGRRLVQHVVVLGDGYVEDGLLDEGLTFEFTVHYLRGEPVEPLLADARLAPFATLAGVPDEDRPRVLRQAFDLIATVADADTQLTLAQAAVDLAALHLTPGTIDQTWEDSAMTIPSLLQRKYEEGLERGVERGLEEGLEQAAASMLRHRFGEDDRIDAIARRLAPLGPDEYLRRIEAAAALEDLAS